MQFDVYADASGSYRWRLLDGNGQNVASSGESFASQSNATRAAEGFKAGAKTYTYEIYEDAGGNYRWRAKAGNGEKVASSGESFSSRSNATSAADNVRDNAGSATGP
ncbi:DUF1508 domain-containing protein [Conexibacter sp. CPCC 206217]|uniref:YegP family protein n=1 Tax=Conexibacter sp. CPCC 206217 TaxID=3064574 RepID=UPI0027289031|nr:DUF1508 domain-containing protein [Conexibacter sp. CPCC 206217]MDO8209641.1 DUF1508 domain-containing protein [Conexibacter sp. CPCC 206217]